MKQVGSSYRTAIHEAGHAVIGRAMRQVCGGVIAIADHDSLGHSICEDPYFTYAEWDARAIYRDLESIFIGRIISMMAGAEAERYILDSSDGGDCDGQIEVAMMMSEVSMAEQRLRAFARHLVRRHQTTIRTLADLLHERGKLTGEEVDAILAGDYLNFNQEKSPVVA